MAGKNQMRDTLIRERDTLLRQRDALDNQIMGLERAIALIGGDETIASTKPGGRRTNTKGVVLKLLEEVGTSGLNAAIAVELASRRGASLDRNSVSSLLSRLKSDGIVLLDADRYKLSQFDPNRQRSGDVVDFDSRRTG